MSLIEIQPPIVNSGNLYSKERVIADLRNRLMRASGEPIQTSLAILVDQAENALKLAERHLPNPQTPSFKIWEYVYFPIEEYMQDLVRHGPEGKIYAGVCFEVMKDLITKSPHFHE